MKSLPVEQQLELELRELLSDFGYTNFWVEAKANPLKGHITIAGIIKCKEGTLYENV